MLPKITFWFAGFHDSQDCDANIVTALGRRGNHSTESANVDDYSGLSLTSHGFFLVFVHFGLWTF